MFFAHSTASGLRRGLTAGLAVAGVFALQFASTTGFAQDTSTQDSAPAAQDGQAGEELGTWIKICAEDQNSEGKEACLVTQEVRTETGDFLGSVSVRQTVGEDQKMLMVAVPPGTLLQPGFRVQVDEGDQQPGKYVICLPNACYGELEIQDSFVNEMKAGQNLIVSVINNKGEAVGIGLTLVGFTKGWDGPPVDTELLAQERQRLQDQLQKRAADARQRLLEQQQGQSGEGAGQPQTQTQ